MTEQKRLNLLSVLMVCCLVLLGFGAKYLASQGFSDRFCGESFRTDKQISLNGHKLNAQLADSNSERTDGLSGRSCIGTNEATLFVFDKPGNYAFWMKDMKFPIDIVWLGQTKNVVYIQKNVEPATYPHSFINNMPAQYVLELKAGTAEALHISNNSIANF